MDLVNYLLWLPQAGQGNPSVATKEKEGKAKTTECEPVKGKHWYYQTRETLKWYG